MVDNKCRPEQKAVMLTELFCLQYPGWLSENKDKLDAQAHRNYTKQYELMEKICTEFESEEASDSEERQKQRFETVMEYMQQMQEYGQPPKEIVGEMVWQTNLWAWSPKVKIPNIPRAVPEIILRGWVGCRHFFVCGGGGGKVFCWQRVQGAGGGG